MTEFNEDTITGDILNFETALQSGHEEAIQVFLEEHPIFLGFLGWHGIVKSKFRLADAFIPDFISIGSYPFSNRPQPLVTFIEIERADMPLFTKSGDPTSFLTHAIRQVQDWKRWVTDNRMYLKAQLQIILTEETPQIFDEDNRYMREESSKGIAYGFIDRYLVIAGRRSSTKISDRLLLGQMNDDFQDIRIMTYDALIEGVLIQLRHHKRDRFWGDILE
ncbi:MAG TPA: Shedu anti-phage system protein SduA domain-containing protein [Blastocatellia bacterium]|nr:Shedu anti-phage system protein SduA domain-containing protein [Blastocatellia bacterium]